MGSVTSFPDESECRVVGPMVVSDAVFLIQRKLYDLVSKFPQWIKQPRLFLLNSWYLLNVVLCSHCTELNDWWMNFNDLQDCQEEHGITIGKYGLFLIAH
jgi:hypothetical protein